MPLQPPPRFVNMPAGTVFDPRLPDAIFRTLAQLHGLAWQTKGERTPPATVAEFAKLRGLKERRMYDHLRDLKKLGFIRVENLGRNRIVIFPLRWDPGAALPTDDDTLPADTSADENMLPLRWEPGAALPTATADEIFTAINCSIPDEDSNSTAINCSKSPHSTDFTAKDCSARGSRCSSSFKDSEYFKKQQRQQTTNTAKNCSNFPPAYQPLLELLVERCGTPRNIAGQAVCAAAQREDDPDWVAYDALRWLAYCSADVGKSINAPGIFIARKIEQAEPCPDYFVTDYSHPLHAEIRTLEMKLE